MNSTIISWKNSISNPLTTVLNIILLAFGTGIITLLLLASDQIGKKLENNSKNIDLVVGAKGSPLQLILSSIYHIDFPTGNIPLADARKLAGNPLVAQAVPLALGDSYEGYRIVGTDTGYISLYNLKIAHGRFWKQDFEVTIGANVAREQKLAVGDTFFGAHGLTSNQDEHRDHAYTVTGILQPQNSVADNLVLTNMASVWRMHEEHDDEDEHHEGETPEEHAEHAGAADERGHHHEGETPEEHAEHTGAADTAGRDITTLLIRYRSPMAVVMFPRMVNESTNMQAASPAMESARLFSLVGVGVDTLQWFAILIIAISAISIFISLYNSLKERKYDLAVMRTMGASRIKLFTIVILEGLLVSLIGTLVGIALGHISLEVISRFQDSTQAKLNGMVFVMDEVKLLAMGLGIGLVAAVIPAIQAYRSSISTILAKNQ